ESETRAALIGMVSRIRGKGSIPILATVAPRIHESNALTDELNDDIRGIARSYGVTLAEVNENLAPVAGPLLYRDNLHPNDLGSKLVAEAFAAAITGTPLDQVDLTGPLPTAVSPAPGSVGVSLTATVRIVVAEYKHAIDPALAS